MNPIDLIAQRLTRHLSTVELIEFIRTANEIRRLPVIEQRKGSRA